MLGQLWSDPATSCFDTSHSNGLTLSLQRKWVKIRQLESQDYQGVGLKEHVRFVLKVPISFEKTLYYKITSQHHGLIKKIKGKKKQQKHANYLLLLIIACNLNCLKGYNYCFCYFNVLFSVSCFPHIAHAHQVIFSSMFFR